MPSVDTSEAERHAALVDFDIAMDQLDKSGVWRWSMSHDLGECAGAPALSFDDSASKFTCPLLSEHCECVMFAMKEFADKGTHTYFHQPPR